MGFSEMGRTGKERIVMTSKHAYLGGLSAAVVLLAGLAFVAPAGADDAATVTYGANSLSFAPQVVHRGGTVTVSGNEITVRREFGAGDTVTVAAVDMDGNPLPDGSYNWEIVFYPGKADLSRADAKSGRTSEDGGSSTPAKLPKGWTQSGSFTIAGGAIINPDAAEESGNADASGGEGR